MRRALRPLRATRSGGGSAVAAGDGRGARADGGGAGGRLWLALATVYVVWGSTYLAIRVAVETLPPFLMAAVRFLVAGTILFAWAARRGDVEGDRLGPRQWGASAIVGGLLLLGGNGCVVWAEQYVDSGVAALIIAIVPIWMVLFGAALAREGVRGRTVAGLVIGLAGIALLIRSAGSEGAPVHTVGAVVLVMATISWALGSVLSRRLPLPRRPLVATAMEMLCGGAMLAAFGMVAGELGDVNVERASLASVLGLAYLIVFGSLVAFSAYVWLLENATMAVVSTYAYVNPVIAVFLGWLVLQERVTWLTAVAGAFILAAVVLILQTEARRRREPQPVARAPVRLVPEPHRMEADSQALDRQDT